MTAVLDFRGTQARLIIKDPLASDHVVVAGHNYPLAADFTIGPAAMLAENRPQRLGRFVRAVAGFPAFKLVNILFIGGLWTPIFKFHFIGQEPNDHIDDDPYKWPQPVFVIRLSVLDTLLSSVLDRPACVIPR